MLIIIRLWIADINGLLYNNMVTIQIKTPINDGT